MKLDLKRDFCLWIVPPSDGRVRKLRLTVGRTALILAVTVIVASGFLYVAGDYARVQFARLKDALFLQQVTAERDALEEEKASLHGEISELKEKNNKVIAYESNVKGRIDELKSLLQSASELGVIPGEVVATDGQKRAVGGAEQSGHEEEAHNEEVGGAEVDCRPGECALNGQPSSLSSLVAPQSGARPEDLISTLDQVIRVLKYAPIGSPANGHVSSPFGMRRSPFSGRLRKHQGVDFSVPHGSEVTSTGEGVVKSVRRTRTYGLVVDIEHSDGVMTRYAHLSKALVSRGEKICRGEFVGLVGSTGFSTGPHLHYEVHVDGKAVNPQGLMTLARRLVESL